MASAEYNANGKLLKNSEMICTNLINFMWKNLEKKIHKLIALIVTKIIAKKTADGLHVKNRQEIQIGTRILIFKEKRKQYLSGQNHLDGKLMFYIKDFILGGLLKKH